jgi:hypothetical protein
LPKNQVCHVDTQGARTHSFPLEYQRKQQCGKMYGSAGGDKIK